MLFSFPACHNEPVAMAADGCVCEVAMTSRSCNFHCSVCSCRHHHQKTEHLTRIFNLFFFFQLVNGGEDVLVFYNDRSSFQVLVQMMGSERERTDDDGALAYHNTLVELLAACTEGKNVYTELKCNSLLPLDDIVKVVTDVNCIPEVMMRPETSHSFFISSHLCFISSLDISPEGENCVCELRQSLLCGHRSRNEGDLHVQPHLEVV